MSLVEAKKMRQTGRSLRGHFAFAAQPSLGVTSHISSRRPVFSAGVEPLPVS